MTTRQAYEAEKLQKNLQFRNKFQQKIEKQLDAKLCINAFLCWETFSPDCKFSDHEQRLSGIFMKATIAIQEGSDDYTLIVSPVNIKTSSAAKKEIKCENRTRSWVVNFLMTLWGMFYFNKL